MSNNTHKRYFSLLRSFIGSIALTVSILAAALVAAPVQAAVTATGTTSISHSGHGSMVEFFNKTGTKEDIKIGSDMIGDGYEKRFKGANNDNDWSGQASFQDGTTVDLHANNPFTSEAYFQVGPHKVYNEAYVKHNGKNFHVNFIKGSWDVGDPVVYKLWKVTCTGNDGFYTHEFIHHRDMVDGVKGTVMNKTSKEVKVRVGGAALTLAPHQRMLYFDAGLHSGDKGMQMTVLRPGTDQGAFTVEAVDPSIGYPKATVVDADGGKDVTYYSQGQAKVFTTSVTDFKLVLTRQPDHKLPCIYENHSTSDWAVFDVDIVS